MAGKKLEVFVANCVAVLGASSFVGCCLLSLLNKADYQVLAFSRSIKHQTTYIEWRQLPTHSNEPLTKPNEIITNWISVAPIWMLPNYFSQLEKAGIQRLVALSSTSVFTKKKSADPNERALAEQLTQAEANIQSWAESVGVQWVILRPTLIYGLAGDKNIVEIASFIRRFNFFPLFGKAEGLRQPVRVEDVASACIACLVSPKAKNHAYNISGAQILSYREMVTQVFIALNKKVHLLTMPLWLFTFAVVILRLLPRYKSLSVAMVERMNQNMIFEHNDATRDFNFQSQPFHLTEDDIGCN